MESTAGEQGCHPGMCTSLTNAAISTHCTVAAMSELGLLGFLL